MVLTLAQIPDPTKAAGDLLKATEVLPFFQALCAVLAGVILAGGWFLFSRWQTAEGKIDDIHAEQLKRMEKTIARLSGTKESTDDA